jgi:hypothetical protein
VTEDLKSVVFTSDEDGHVTHLRGVEVRDAIHTLAVDSIADRAPPKKYAWVLTGVYAHAKQVQEGAPSPSGPDSSDGR